ncbi:MAG: hypothetical protein ABI844_01235 [Saprospiraceae bacterium]
MTRKTDPLNTLSDIKSMMEKSSRFLSLSGLSGIGMGIIALAAAFSANNIIKGASRFSKDGSYPSYPEYMTKSLLILAVATLIIALAVGLFFTIKKAKKLRLPLLDNTSRRMLINLFIPLLAGGIYLLKLLDIGYVELLTPSCLIFYGLALIHASKYTLGDIRYLGIIEIILGLFNLFWVSFGLWFWAIGFGLAHIMYGMILWNKYDKVD